LEQYDLENELQSVARHAKEDAVAGVIQDVGDEDEEHVGVDSTQGGEEDDEDALLEFSRHLFFLMASVALSIGLIQHSLRFSIYRVN
jgi:hypothetical protein